ncbi:hypothetical protein IDG86_05610, partial [Pelagibacterales bacterium SAG-MED13]|nr:hypothetical protein [Pelagibacterales bacterium SAG-MED13]
MKLSFYKVIFFFLFFSICQANENIRFVDLNYIVNNSKIGKSLNEIIENKNNKIKKDLDDLKKSLDDKKNKIVSQKNIIKKEEFQKLVNNYEKDVVDFKNLRKTKT